MEVREVKIEVKQCEIWPSLEMNEKYELRIQDRPHASCHLIHALERW